MPLTLEGFVRAITDCGLTETDEVHGFIEGLPEVKRPRSAEELAREMFKAGRLTKFQAQAIF